MLSILEVQPQQSRGFFARRWRSIFPPPVEGYMQTVGQTPYVRITCETGKSGLDWRMIAAYCLDAGGRLLMPNAIHCPEDSGLRSFRPTAFRRRLLENLMLDVLVSMRIPPAERRLAIYSREAEVLELLPRLVPLIGELRVITRRPYVLCKPVEDTMRGTGMPITMTDRPDARGCHILLAPDGGAGLIELDSSCTVFSPVYPRQGCVQWINAARAVLPPVLEDIYAPEYDKNEFVGAFYEIGGMRALGQTSPACGVCFGRDMTADEIAERADCAAS